MEIDMPESAISYPNRTFDPILAVQSDVGELWLRFENRS